MQNATETIFQIAIVIFSVVIHEVSHGFAALALGDHTAESQGRLTLNPLKHIDPIGSVLVPLLSYALGGVLFGWAKPVPYNPYNLRIQKWGPAIVGVAGPLANILLAIVFGLTLRFLPGIAGSAPGPYINNFMTIASTIAFLNLILAFFNLIPVPPLDGSKVLFALLPYRWIGVQRILEQYGIFLFLVFIILFSNIIILPAVYSFRLITGMFPLL